MRHAGMMAKYRHAGRLAPTDHVEQAAAVLGVAATDALACDERPRRMQNV
jgi:hypothetical protein